MAVAMEKAAVKNQQKKPCDGFGHAASRKRLRSAQLRRGVYEVQEL